MAFSTLAFGRRSVACGGFQTTANNGERRRCQQLRLWRRRRRQRRSYFLPFYCRLSCYGDPNTTTPPLDPAPRKACSALIVCDKSPWWLRPAASRASFRVLFLGVRFESDYSAPITEFTARLGSCTCTTPRFGSGSRRRGAPPTTAAATLPPGGSLPTTVQAVASTRPCCWLPVVSAAKEKEEAAR